MSDDNKLFRRLDRELSAQDFGSSTAGGESLDTYRQAARGYALIEGAIAVLSDMTTGRSYVSHGSFGRTLGLAHSDGEMTVPSIWEDEILRLIHPDDLHAKYLDELRFFHHVRRLPRAQRANRFLAGKLRMRDTSGRWHTALHRLHYVPAPGCNGLWLALCLYTPLTFDFTGTAIVVETADGNITSLGTGHDNLILSQRERQVLRLIDRGMTSKDIAGCLSISLNTVSRHRASILARLRVGNSVEACRIARELGLV